VRGDGTRLFLRDTKAARTTEKVKSASSAELERITTTLLEAMRASGYLDRRPIADVEERMRRLVRRLNLPARDAVVWLGILRQILWKLRSGKIPKTEDPRSLRS